MPSQTKNYATSTYSVSTTYSYDKAPEGPRKTKRTIKHKMMDAVRHIGTSPFEYKSEEEKASLSWVATQPPSRI